MQGGATSAARPVRATDCAAWPRTAAWLAGSLLVSLLVLALALLVRRIAGGLVRPLPAALLLTTGVCVAASIVAIRQVLARAARPPWTVVATGASQLAVICLAGALSLPGTASWALGVWWLLLAAGEGFAWWSTRLLTSAVGHSGPRNPRIQVLPADFVAAQVADQEPAVPVQLVQQLTRERLESGGERIRGLARATFQRDERSQNVHLAFCPPLAHVPTMHARPRNGAAAIVQVAEVQSYGARLEVRRTTFARNGDADVLIEFEAVSERSTGASA